MIGRRGGAARRRMTCWEVTWVLQACLDGEAEEVTARRVATHVEDCRRCGLETAVYREIKNSLARQEVPDEGTMARLRDFGNSERRLSGGQIVVQGEQEGQATGH